MDIGILYQKICQYKPLKVVSLSIEGFVTLPTLIRRMLCRLPASLSSHDPQMSPSLWL